MKLWVAKHLRDTRVVICAQDFECHACDGVLIPQPEPRSRQASYLPSHPSFEVVDVPNAKLRAFGLGDMIPAGAGIAERGDGDETESREEPEDALDLESMSLDELKSLARRLDINPGNSGRDRLVQKIQDALEEE